MIATNDATSAERAALASEVSGHRAWVRLLGTIGLAVVMVLGLSLMPTASAVTANAVPAPSVAQDSTTAGDAGPVFAKGASYDFKILMACWRSGCNGLDPEQQSCGSRSTLGGTVYVEMRQVSGSLRYSAQCGAKWARIIQDSSCCYLNYRAHLQRSYIPSGSITNRYSSYTTNSQGTRWTSMLGSHINYTFRACIDGQLRNCGAWVRGYH